MNDIRILQDLENIKKTINKLNNQINLINKKVKTSSVQIEELKRNVRQLTHNR